MTKKIINISKHWTLHDTQTTTNAYVTMWGDVDTRELEEVTLMLFETGAANGIDYRVDKGIGGGLWHEIIATTALVAGTSALEANLFTTYGAGLWLRVQIRATVGGAQGDVEMRLYGNRF